MIRVLILDDDKLTRQGLISAMPWAEFHMRVVGEAGNGKEALRFLRSNEVDLVLCDLEMPQMPGLEFIEAACALYPDMFFVVLTLYTDFSKVQKALRLGAIDYIAKVDFDRESFRVILKRILTRIEKENERRSGQKKMSVDFQALSDEWRALGWLRDDMVFERMKEDVKRLGLSGGDYERLMGEIIKGLNDEYACIKTFPEALALNIPDWREAWARLGECKRLADECARSFHYSRDVFDCVLKARIIIDNRLADQLYAGDVARLVGMSRSYFCQCFRDVYKMSFLEYLRMIRLRRAAQMLEGAGESIQSIARQTGYADEKYFSKVFKSEFGVIPSDYRKAARQNRKGAK